VVFNSNRTSNTLGFRGFLMSNKWLSGFDLSRSRTRAKKKDGSSKLKRALDEYELIQELRKLEKQFNAYE